MLEDGQRDCVRLCETLKTAALSFRIKEEEKAALERAAAADERSVSSLTQRIIRDWLIDRGYLTPLDMKSQK